MAVVGAHYVSHGVVLLLRNSVLGERLHERFCGLDA